MTRLWQLYIAMFMYTLLYGSNDMKIICRRDLVKIFFGQKNCLVQCDGE